MSLCKLVLMVSITQTISDPEFNLHSFITKSILSLKLKRLVIIRFSRKSANVVTHLPSYGLKNAMKMIFLPYIYSA